jgi:putative ABC transport system permease protein
MRNWFWLERRAQDIRHGVRRLSRSPGLTAAAFLTLALGFGASATIFSIVHGVLLRPLPIHEPDRVITFWLSAPKTGLPEAQLCDALFASLRQRARTLESLAAYEPGAFVLTDRGEPEVVDGVAVTVDYFRVLGVRPLHGRSFLAEEDSPGNNHVVVLSYELWQRRFGGDMTLLGSSIRLDNVPTAVVGILPPGFDFPKAAERSDLPGRPQVWTLRTIDPQDRTSWNLSPVGRLAPGAAPADARNELGGISSTFVREQAGHTGSLGSDPGLVLVRLSERILGGLRAPVTVLLLAVCLVLMIGCANVANLLLARTAARMRDIALRSCLGASAPRIAGELITEALLLAVLGAGGGLVLAFVGVATLRALPVTAVPRLETVAVDATVVLFTIALAVLAGALIGLGPAWRGTRMGWLESLNRGLRGSSDRSTRKLNNGFVVLQFALSFVLLVGTGLLLQSLRNLLDIDPGFRAANVISGSVWLPPAKYPSRPDVQRFYESLLDRVRRAPGVRAAGLTNVVPFSGGGDGAPFTVADQLPRPGEPASDAWWRSVTPELFATFGIPILRGRAFVDADMTSPVPIAIVDEHIARTYWPDEGAIGKRIRIGGATSTAPWLTIVGVVPTVKNRRLDEDTKPTIYEPYPQRVRRGMSIAISTSGNPEALTSTLRAQLASLDAELPLFQVATLEQAVARSVTDKRLVVDLLSIFALTAVLLAALGIYGVSSLHVSSRVREFGIRLAIGARRTDVATLVATDVGRLVGLGLMAGALLALWITSLMEGLMFGVRATDRTTFAASALVLIAVAAGACYVPTRRATRVDPVVVLHDD